MLKKFEKKFIRLNNVALMRDMKNELKILLGKPEGKSYWEDLGVDGRIILEHIL
jgi:hypothetical protein